MSPPNDEHPIPPAPDPRKAEPVLRTLAPALRNLERKLTGWLGTRHAYPLRMLDRSALEGLATDLNRQADALDVDRPLLVVMLMGGTGVGKSTLLNALAGGSIAQASVQRPTTRDPVVYYHQSVKPDRLDPTLRHCRLAAHDREPLLYKVLVDTPDVDSNDLANRERLLGLLPVADIVLYVGSQEKYHDQLVWELFKQQRKRRAFAFILNKWDRCLLQAPAEGDEGPSRRPDDDLLHDLSEEGFQSPLLFRTAAQRWIDQMNSGGDGSPPPDLPPGEQFRELTDWLEKGLTRLEIEAVKARGVSQLFEQLQETLGRVLPPDLAAEAIRTQEAWEQELAKEAENHTEVLVSTLDPYQSEIEHHFSVEGQRRFRGLMALFLKSVIWVRYAGSSLRDRVPFLPRPAQEKVETPTTWDVHAFTRECSRVAGERVLDKRGTSLVNRLLIEADQQGFPAPLLNEPTQNAAKIDWRGRYDRALLDTLTEVEQIWIKPTGSRKWLQTTLVTLANYLPNLAFIATVIVLLWRLFMTDQHMDLNLWWLVLIVPLLTVVILHMLVELLLPMRWRAIRGEFQRRLNRRLAEALHDAYAPIPADVSANLRADRERIEQLRAEVADVAQWLAQREQAANIQGLYGN